MHKSRILFIALTVGGSIAAAAVAIGTIGDAVDAWTSFLDWLKSTFGFTSLDQRIVIGTFAILLFLLALLILVARRHIKDQTRAGRSSETIRQGYLQWLGEDIENRRNSSIHRAKFIDLVV